MAHLTYSVMLLLLLSMVADSLNVSFDQLFAAIDSGNGNDPCDSFYDHVCDGHGILEDRNLQSLLENSILERLYDLTTSPVESGDNLGIVYAKTIVQRWSPHRVLREELLDDQFLGRQPLLRWALVDALWADPMPNSDNLQNMRRGVQNELLLSVFGDAGLDGVSKDRLFAQITHISAFYGRPRGNLHAYYSKLPPIRDELSAEQLLAIAKSFEKDRKAYTDWVLTRKSKIASHWERVVFDMRHNSFDFPRAYFITGDKLGYQDSMIVTFARLHPPFANTSYPASAQFGLLGVTMGHELTHSIANRLMRPGKTIRPGARAHLLHKAQCVKAATESFSFPGNARGRRRVNGTRSLNEDLADAGGVRWAYRAFLTLHEPSEAEEREFFYAYAMQYCSGRDGRVPTNKKHSPPKVRVDSPLMQLSAFGWLFGCEAGTPMNPVDRSCAMWD